MLVTENQLDVWVRGNARDAQGVIVELVWRLAAASCPGPRERRFPLSDSIGQHGPDGVLDVALPFDPFVPDGRSYWEVGSGVNARDKASSDYKKLTEDTPADVRGQSTFVFVTPLSGQRDWEHTWKDDGQAAWTKKRLERAEWRDVRVIDGTKLIDWVRQFPAVEVWLAGKTLGLQTQQIDTPEQHWSLIRSIGEPPPLAPGVFLANRDDACAKLKAIFDGTAIQLRLTTHAPDQVIDFVAAYLGSLHDDIRVDAAGRCLIVSGPDAWRTITTRSEKHVLVADSGLSLYGEAGTKLIQMARNKGHAIVFGGLPGGIADETSVPLPEPRDHQLREALKKSGYSEERARTLAQRTGGHLGSLLRCLQELPLMSEWAEGSAAAELAVAVALGSWSEKTDADRTVIEGVSGKPYVEWIGEMREIAVRPGTPLTQRDGSWRFAARHEGWYSLGRWLFDDHLDRLSEAAISVLREKDPQFDLPPDERYAAAIHGKVLAHSDLLRTGLAELLALFGSHPAALTSCTAGKPEATAVLAVREILTTAEWFQWASLGDLLPLLAEAAPTEFLEAVEAALRRDPCPFDQLFAQELGGALGRTHMSGLLWALETLAWDAALLTRVVMCLGKLSARDPGGQWSNRPANSLSAILLPWLPQTCASSAKQEAAVKVLLAELPNAGWELLLALLPKGPSTSSCTRRPAWRVLIPDNWQHDVTIQEYREQVTAYSELAVAEARRDMSKVAALVGRLDDIPQAARERLLEFLGSGAVTAAQESEKLSVWTELVDLVSRHRRFSDAEWAMKPELVDEIASVADRLASEQPSLRHQRLFSERDFDLHEGKGNYEEQQKELERRRREAVEDIVADGGLESVPAFARAVESPWRVGVALGAVGDERADRALLPGLLGSEEASLSQLTGGFVRGRLRARGWDWVDSLDASHWTPGEIAQLLASLPFTKDAWQRSVLLLGESESAYWTKTAANPFEADGSVEAAVEKLIAHGRPGAAIRCLHRMVLDEEPLDSGTAVRALLEAVGSPESVNCMDAHEMVEVIKVLQNDPAANADDLQRVEWAYLPLLHDHMDALPTTLERRLATEPGFFCDLIRVVFRSKNEERPTEEPTEERKRIAANAYRLLSKWRIPPGSRDGAEFDGDALGAWIEAVKRECAETGHLEIAMTMVGRVLMNVPRDPDGLWIHRSAAAALNAEDGGDMREGLRTQIYNSRGVHWVDPTGKPERELAATYREHAEAVDLAGYPRLSATVRDLVDTYDREAERVSSRDPFGD